MPSEEIIKRDQRIDLWDIDRRDGQFICDRTVFTVDEWQARGDLQAAIERAAHARDANAVDSLLEQFNRLGRKTKQGVFASAADTMRYFHRDIPEFAYPAHRQVAKVDPTIGNWVPPRHDRRRAGTRIALHHAHLPQP